MNDSLTQVEIGTIVTGIASNAGGQLLSVVTTAIPAVLPFAAVFFGIRYVLKRIGLRA
jgi:hypothetical protein